MRGVRVLFEMGWNINMNISILQNQENRKNGIEKAGNPMDPSYNSMNNSSWYYVDLVLYWRCNSYAYSTDQSLPVLLIPIRTQSIRTASLLSSAFIDSYSHTVL